MRAALGFVPSRRAARAVLNERIQDFPHDEIALVAFANTTKILCDPLLAGERADWMRLVLRDQMDLRSECGEGSDLTYALRSARKLFGCHESRASRNYSLHNGRSLELH